MGVDLSHLPTEPNWDSHGGQPTTWSARSSVNTLTIVPTSNGGIQIEMHTIFGEDVEIEIGPTGRVVNVMFDASEAER